MALFKAKGTILPISIWLLLQDKNLDSATSNHLWFPADALTVSSLGACAGEYPPSPFALVLLNFQSSALRQPHMSPPDSSSDSAFLPCLM